MTSLIKLAHRPLVGKKKKKNEGITVEEAFECFHVNETSFLDPSSE